MHYTGLVEQTSRFAEAAEADEATDWADQYVYESVQPFYVAEDTAESSALVERVRSAARAENQAAAQRLVATGELWALRLRECGEREDWIIDAVEAVTAEVAAALGISQGVAGSYLRYARAMRERLPAVAAVFVAGDLDYRLFQTIVYRTELITDADAVRRRRAGLDGRRRLDDPARSRCRTGQVGDSAPVGSSRRRTAGVCIRAIEGVGRFRALPRPDMPVSGVRSAGSGLRSRPHHPSRRRRAHPCIESEMLVPLASSAQALTAGEMNFAATHRYVDATAKSCHSPGTPLSS